MSGLSTKDGKYYFHEKRKRKNWLPQKKSTIDPGRQAKTEYDTGIYVDKTSKTNEYFCML